MNKVNVPEYVDSLIKELPDEGPSQDLSHEIARAYNKIIWDWNNNGFGNDWMPAVLFLSVMEEIYLDEDYIGQSDILLCGLGIYAGNATDKYKERIVKELNNLGSVVERLIHAYKAEESNEITGVDFWNFNSWKFLLNKSDLYSGADNSKAFNWNFTDVLEQLTEVMSACNCLDKFRDIMDNASKYLTAYNGIDSEMKDNIRSELIDCCEISEEDADWYVNELPYQLSRNRPLWY